MANENEPAKLLLPYLQRADELQKHEPLVAYYCRLCAMQRGLKIPTCDRTKTTNALLVSLMNQLEKKLMSNSDFVDDDEALMQAIALSLKDSVECSDVGCSGLSQSADLHLTDGMINERKGKAYNQEDTRKRKRKKPVTSRVQMTEDELVLHFFQFDESGKGGISLRDLKRVAAAHDFTWTDNEMVDMIYCFDSNGDGKLSLDDFRKIVGQCNMIQVSENSVIGSKA